MINVDKKEIITSEGRQVMGITEVRKTVENMMYTFAWKCVNSLQILNNLYSLEDYLQVAEIELIECYRNYSSEHNTKFSSYFQTYLLNKQIQLLRKQECKKRKISNNDLLSLDDNTVQYGVTDKHFTDNYIEICLLDKLSDIEKTMIAVQLDRELVREKSASSKNSLISVINLFLENEFAMKLPTLNKITLAKELKITRPTLDERTKKAFKKAQDIVLDCMRED